MTLKATGYCIVCDMPNCGRIQDIPARDVPEARDLADKLGWREVPAGDLCPEHVALEQARGHLGPREADPQN